MNTENLNVGKEKMQNSKKLLGKVAIITGGASGFGHEVASIFSEEGAKIIIWDIDEKKGNRLAKMIKARGGESIFSRVDVSSSDNIRKAVEEIENHYKKVDILINNAGIHQYAIGTVVDVSEEEYDKVMNTNTKSVFLCSKYVIPMMKKNGGGSIVNIASVWGHFASNNVPIYCISKAAVEHLTKVMALDHVSDKIRVNCISPGTCRTQLVEKMVDLNYLKLGYATPDEMWEARRKAHPIGRLGTPRDVANLTLFLASNDSSWITGSIITIDGGYSLGKIFSGK